MAAALNRRIHHDTIDANAPKVVAAHGDQIRVGDIIVSARNDTTITVRNAETNTPAANPVRNGNRWRVYAIDTEHQRIAARRLHDDARAVFSGDYLTHDIRHGYAITVHAAQGATADTTHAVLGDRTNRTMLYVAMTRGRETNTAYIYEHEGEIDRSQAEAAGVHVMRRGTRRDAATAVREILGTQPERLQTAHDVAAAADRDQLPDRTRRLLIDRRARDIQRRRVAQHEWRARTAALVARMRLADKYFSRDHRRDRGLEL